MEISFSFIKGWLFTSPPFHQTDIPPLYAQELSPAAYLRLSVTLLKEFQAFLSFLCRNPVTEGRCSFFHAVLLERLPVPFPRTGYFILFLRNPYLFSLCCKGYRAALSNCFAVTFISYKVPYFYTLSRFKLERHLWIY